ncbi:hypothetical protein ECG_05241 [Echinococcus granulosus]|nr:hypothetical protein ECG_05241 [Echinococcus granulosus]
MFDSDCEDVLPLDWQAEVDEENGVCYKNLKSGTVVNRHPLIGAKLFLPPMPKHWLKVTTDQECSVFINLKTGAQSYADPRLALPLLRTPGGNPTQYPKFDDLSTIAERCRRVPRKISGLSWLNSHLPVTKPTLG